METRVGKESDDVAGGAAGGRESRCVRWWWCAHETTAEAWTDVTREWLRRAMNESTKSGGWSRVGKITTTPD